MSRNSSWPEGEQTPSEDYSPLSQYPLKCLLSYHMDTNHISSLEGSTPTVTISNQFMQVIGNRIMRVFQMGSDGLVEICERGLDREELLQQELKNELQKAIRDKAGCVFPGLVALQDRDNVGSGQQARSRLTRSKTFLSSLTTKAKLRQTRGSTSKNILRRCETTRTNMLTYTTA